MRLSFQVQQCLHKGGLKREHYARLALGIAAFHSKDETLARQALEALLSEKSVNWEASYWLKRMSRPKKSDRNQDHSDKPAG